MSKVTSKKLAKMTNEESFSLLESILCEQDEAGVTPVLNSNPYTANPGNWLPLGDNEGNWNIIFNQATSGPKAATELMTNMADAKLLHLCVAAGIDPRSPEAPQTSREAIETFLGWKGGRFSEEMTQRECTAWASKNLVVAFGGHENPANKPSLTFCDTGEGQHPADFERTFLNLKPGYKDKIRFVQGKFNMGSSGVAAYCGDHAYKLIISRKHTLDGEWGWTIIRRRPGGKTIDYFKVGGRNGSIPSFTADRVRPLFTRSGQRYDDISFEHGTIVKLYDYFISSDGMSNTYNSTRSIFQEHIADTLMPIRILDMRVAPSRNKGKARAAGVDGRTFGGMEYHISTGISQSDVEDESQTAKGTRRIDIGEYICPTLGRIVLRGHFSEEPFTGRSAAGGVIRSNNRIFHSVNGQIQYRMSRGVLNECGLSALKDNLLIVVDASGMNSEPHSRIWKADRETIIQNQLGLDYLALVRKMIKDSDDLKELNREVEESRRKQANRDVLAQNLFQRMVSNNPALAAIFGGKSPALAAASGKSVRVENKVKLPAYVGTFSPDFLTLKVPASGIELPRGGSAVIKATTSVADDYLVRDIHPGEITVSDNLKEAGIIVTRRGGVKNGNMFIQLEAPENAPLGEMVISIGLMDAGMSEPMTSECLIRVVEMSEEEVPKETKPRAPKQPKQTKLSMPLSLIYTRDGRDVFGASTIPWDRIGWSEKDGCKIDFEADGTVVTSINFDFEPFQKALSAMPEVEREAAWTKCQIALQVNMIETERDIKDRREAGEKIDDDALDTALSVAFNGMARAAMTVVHDLPKALAAALDEPVSVD